MHRFLRHFLFFLVVAALWLSYGSDFAAGKLMAAGEVSAASPNLPGVTPHGHDHGLSGEGDLHHCVTASCASVFMIQAHRAALRDSSVLAKFDVPSDGWHVRSAYLDRDPPIPRFTS